jgi:hypothetical protein
MGLPPHRRSAANTTSHVEAIIRTTHLMSTGKHPIHRLTIIMAAAFIPCRC